MVSTEDHTVQMLIEILFEDAMGSSIRLDSCNQALSRLYMFRDEVASHNEIKYSLISVFAKLCDVNE